MQTLNNHFNQSEMLSTILYSLKEGEKINVITQSGTVYTLRRVSPNYVQTLHRLEIQNYHISLACRVFAGLRTIIY